MPDVEHSHGSTLLVVGRLMSPLHQGLETWKASRLRCAPSMFVVHATVGIIPVFHSVLYHLCYSRLDHTTFILNVLVANHDINNSTEETRPEQPVRRKEEQRQ